MVDDTENHFQGVTDDTPDEILDFVRSNDVADKYTVMLKQQPDGGGKPQTLRSFSNYYPNVNTLGREWGPGSYILVFSWQAVGISGKKETVTKDYKLELPERAWGDEHDTWLQERRDKALEAKTKRWKEDAIKDTIMRPVQPQTQQDPVDNLKKSIETLKALGVPIGGPAPKAEKEVPKRDWAAFAVNMAPLVTAMMPLAVALISKVKPKDDREVEKMLLAHALNKPENDNMKTVLPFLMGSIKQIFELKESMQPEEKVGWVEKIFDKMGPMVPMVIAAVAESRSTGKMNPLVAMAGNSADAQKIKEDPELQILAANKLDQKYGFQQANDVMEAMGMVRPAETLGNFAFYPSDGYDTHGQPITVANGPTADIRDVPAADVKPSANAAEDDTLV